MSAQRTASEKGGQLKAVLRVQPHPEAGCFVSQVGPEGDDVTQDLVCYDAGCTDCECRAEVSVPGGSTRQFVAGEVHDRCVCPVFREFDCLPSIEAVEGNELVVCLSLPDRSELTDIVSRLREIGASVQLDRLSRSETGDCDRILQFEAKGITDKQREAIRVAIEFGYYESPRQADLGDLADELGVSRSAVSQRLGSVESKLVTELFRAEHGSGVEAPSPDSR
ncbi:MAG: helix-turn-helix domain-containing protein [Haloferacaceae archaeon]